MGRYGAYCVELVPEGTLYVGSVLIHPVQSPWRDPALLERVPRIEACPSKYVLCCGQCTRKCLSRCLLDVQSRLNFHYLNLRTARELENSRLLVPQEPGTMESILSEPVEYKHACEIVAQLISGWHNADKRRRLRDNGIRENPHKFDYAPQVLYDFETGKPLVDPRTGFPRTASWPDSGLCPHCLPRTRNYIGTSPRVRGR